jgi:SAM-dependent methyltransferase
VESSLLTSLEAVDPKRIVERGYDMISARYSEWHRAHDWPVARFARELDDRLPDGSQVLELGCGDGVPATELLARRHRVTAVDISERQLDRARANVPAATFIHGDMVSMEFEPGSFGGVGMFLSMTHVPRDEHPELLRRIHTWLEPGGVLVCSMGTTDSADWHEEDWLGAPSFFSHFDTETNLELVRDTGFEIEFGEPVTMLEDDAEVAFLWIVARRPKEVMS